MSHWTETPKGRRAREAIVETGRGMSGVDAMRVAAAMCFLSARTQAWSVDVWHKWSGSLAVVFDIREMPATSTRADDMERFEWALIEAVCKVLDIEADQKRKGKGCP